ncbi:hypothetical protein F511_12020 [Dorcoceras hygrometricum]|uniref:Uncharacterized protein n=1 Tax=Dorcoceras hygrometricum TaxID=472368 RepID=A0A2Z7D0W2_9LAMI|nr:hypothetical protein F511_12020 [Dorcoceras hygrometricum]
MISSGLLVQADEGTLLPVVDLIDESTAAYREEPVFFVIPVGARRQSPARLVAGRYVRRAWRDSARPCAARYVAAATVRRSSDSDATAEF